MHINAFFDYLLNNPHPYWTQIPTDPNPVCEDGRDGVAPEDDMALRALLPHIRPRRGRKRPGEDGLSKSPSQRPRLDSPSSSGETRTTRPDTLDPWTAHPDGRVAANFQPVDPRSSVLPEANSAFPWSNDVSREPMSAYPQSAMTPSTRGTFWGDAAEPRSAISPSKFKSLGRRHGAKVVSSAWRSGGISAGGRPRGRPPVNRLSDTPLSAIPDERREYQMPFEKDPPRSSMTPVPMFPPFPSDPIPRSAAPTSVPTSMPTSAQMSMPMSAPTSAPTLTPTSAPGSRQSRPGRLSLQVPERASGPVRLATPPPPVVMINGESAMNGGGPSPGASPGASVPAEATGLATEIHAEDAFTVLDRTSALFTGAFNDHTTSSFKFEPNNKDRVNCEEIEALFIADLLEGNWYDEKGQLGPSASLDEAAALIKTVIASISRQALTKEAFLINLAALAGVKYMMKAGSNTVQRIEIDNEHTKYCCAWGMRYGPVNGVFRLTETVPHRRWKKGAQHPTAERPLESVDVPAEGEAAAEYWRARYADLVRAVNKRSEEASLLMRKAAKEAPSGNESVGRG